MGRSPLTSLNGPLRSALRRLGLTDIDLLLRLAKDWDTLLGAPWAGASSPVMLANKELTVQADTQASVGILRYDISEVIRTVNETVGEGTIEAVRVVGPR